MPKYEQLGISYQRIGNFPKEALGEVELLFRNLCNRAPGVSIFGTCGVYRLPDGALGCALRLFALEMEYCAEMQSKIIEVAKKYNILWFADLLLKHELGYNQFIVSPGGELYAVGW